MDEAFRLAALADIMSVQARLQAMLDFANGKVPKSAAQEVVESVLSKARPNRSAGASHGGNWPVWAEAAIESESFHRDFGNRSSGVTVHYFASEKDADQWVVEEQQHIRDIDYAYSVRARRWGWDLGPEDKGHIYLG